MTPVSDTPKAIADVIAEREKQVAQWGGAEHDDRHSLEEWFSYRAKFENRIYAVRSAELPNATKRRRITRDCLVKIAALCIAQIESLDRVNSVVPPKGVNEK